MITINGVELASELAHKRLVDELVESENAIYQTEDDLWIEDTEDSLIYKDDVQDLFNHWYDYYFSIIEECIVE